jgi:nicotinamidase-related amidase
MSKQAVSNVTYPVTPDTTVLLSIDCQFGFGAGSWEQVPHADAAVENFRKASRAWRQCGGAVAHVQTAYTPQRAPSGRITDFEPGIAAALAAGTQATEPYPDLIADGDLVVYKTTFSAVLSSDLPAQLRARDVDTVVVGGLTTPICVQTTVDGLSMTGFKVIVLARRVRVAGHRHAVGGTGARGRDPAHGLPVRGGRGHRRVHREGAGAPARRGVDR